MELYIAVLMLKILFALTLTRFVKRISVVRILFTLLRRLLHYFLFIDEEF